MAERTTSERAVITSTSALAAVLRETDVVEPAASFESLLAADPLVPMYQIPCGRSEDEAAAAAHVVSETAERLRRLGDAYAEWAVFDASAYFDLSEAQTDRLVRVHERISTVYVVFYIDLLLPSFQQAEAFWVNSFFPVYQAAYQHNGEPRPVAENGGLDSEIYFMAEIQPEMIARWQHLIRVVQLARSILINDIGFLSTNGSQDERAHWQSVWQQDPARGLAAALRPALAEVPTLSLAYEFPLPAYRQSGRRRRLYLNRERQRRRRRGGRS